VGIEPTTFGLKGRCSTTELRPWKKGMNDISVSDARPQPNRRAKTKKPLCVQFRGPFCRGYASNGRERLEEANHFNARFDYGTVINRRIT
jgi:hypothetical protein